MPKPDPMIAENRLDAEYRLIWLLLESPLISLKSKTEIIAAWNDLKRQRMVAGNVRTVINPSTLATQGKPL